GIIMESLHTGDLDVGMEVWLPIQDINYYEKYKDTVDFNETPWFTNGKVGLAVPDYLDEINSVEDLNEHKDLFDGEIIGFEPGAGTMDTTDLLIEDYDLDYRSEEHTSELQSRFDLVCRLLLEKKKKII